MSALDWIFEVVVKILLGPAGGLILPLTFTIPKLRGLSWMNFGTCGCQDSTLIRADINDMIV